MIKKVMTTLSDLINIADIFGYIFVTLIILACWIGYNNAHQKAVETSNTAKMKVEEMKIKMKEMTKQSESSVLETTKTVPTLLETNKKESLFSQYYSSIKSKFDSLTFDNAKESIQELNQSVNKSIKEATGLSHDPRIQNTHKGTPKNRALEEESRDALSTL